MDDTDGRKRVRGEGEPPCSPEELTRILHEVSAGRAHPSDVLLPLVYEELRAIARQRLRDERAQHTLEATALVHEAYLRLAGDAPMDFQNRAHFFGAAARAMRQVLIDYARRRGAAKRGGPAGERARVPLEVAELSETVDRDAVLAVDQAVEKLAVRDPRMAEIVQLRFYAGLSVEETAAALGLSDRTVRREWVLARAWLQRELSP